MTSWRQAFNDGVTASRQAFHETAKDRPVTRHYPGHLNGKVSCGCQFLGETGYPCPQHTVHVFEAQYGADAETLATRLGLQPVEQAKPKE